MFNTLKSGLNFLKKRQQADGSFLSLSSPTKDFKNNLEFHSVFSTALISQSVSKLKNNKTALIINKKTISFLKSQKSKNWSWNYWTKGSKEEKEMPYPDDLDDTFCALAALYLNNNKNITGEALAKITEILTLLEIKEGGPYRTWLVNENADKIWKDVDLGVNLNIAYFLHLQGITLKNHTELFSKALNLKKFTTPYYPNPFPVIYFLSRLLKKRSEKEKLTKVILKYKPKEPLYMALQVLSLINLNFPMKKNIKEKVHKLIKMQKGNGGWQASSFYTGVNPKRNKKFHAGSEALTTAFCLEAVSFYSRSKSKKNKAQFLFIYKSIINHIKNRINSLGPNLQIEFNKYLSDILKKDKDKQITLLPLMLKKSLGVKKAIPNDLVIRLGAASVYGWIAYTIYDDFLDEESKASSLPLANICLRELTITFNDILPEKTGFQKVFKKTMDKLEEANTWEVTHCRFEIGTKLNDLKIPNFKNYDFIANKSLGHALGCVVILMNLGFKENSSEVKNLFLFFKHFIIARQLNDDAHDWEKDLKNGQINSVGAILLKRGKKDLQHIFWHEVIDKVCDLILFHSKMARLSLTKIMIVKNPEFLLKMIEKQERSVEMARNEKKNTLLFLRNYSKNQ